MIGHRYCMWKNIFGSVYPSYAHLPLTLPTDHPLLRPRGHPHGSRRARHRRDTIVILDSDIIAAHANQDKTLRESAADLGAMILEMEREEELHGKNTERLAELKRVRALQEKVVMRMLDGSDRPKRPRLRVVK